LSAIALRASLFVLLVLMLGLIEWRWPRNQALAKRPSRWPVNLGLGLLNVLCVRLLLPWLAIDAAMWARAQHIGLLHWLHAPAVVAIVVSVLALDLIVYAQHRLMHHYGWLWRLHRVHHTDLALDVTSGVRFHPAEILLSMLIKIAAVIALGAPPAAVLGFEILLSSFSLFTHANIALPPRVDAWLRWVFVTPDMHRIHHSVRRDEHDRNFGFHVSWWDRLFGSYCAHPRQTQAQLTLGLNVFRAEPAQRFTALLAQPLRNER
jgi:sterol desaturase/sphingolipid hydroxylase (fatty acid hydroxylase superfamily)